MKIFCKNLNPNDPRDRGKFATLASVCGIVCNLCLFALKLTVGLIATAVAVIADGFNNLSDAGAVLIGLIGLRLSQKHVDKDHPLGHGRMEYVAGFIVDILIIVVGVELLSASVEKIATPTVPTVSNLSMILLGVAVLVKLWLFVFYRKIGIKINSATVKAYSLDSITDCVATTLVLVSALIGKYFDLAVDGYAGLIVAGFIVFTGVKASKETVDLLLGTPPKKEFVEELTAFALTYPPVIGVHDMMVHDYGVGRKFISFHAEVPDTCNISSVHDVIDRLERDMFDKYKCIVTVHMDPVETDDECVNQMKLLAVTSAKEVDESFMIHDFRLTNGGEHKNLIFDLVIPVDSKYTEEEAERLVREKITAKGDNLFVVIHAEHPFV